MKPDSPKHLREELEAKLTALLLGELNEDDAELLRKLIAQDARLAALHERLKLTVDLVRETTAKPAEQSDATQSVPLRLSEERREKLLAHFKTVTPKEFAAKPASARAWLVQMAAAVAIIAFLAALVGPQLSHFSKSYQLSSSIDQAEGAKPQFGTWSAQSSDPNEYLNGQPAAGSLKPDTDGQAGFDLAPPLIRYRYSGGGNQGAQTIVVDSTLGSSDASAGSRTPPAVIAMPQIAANYGDANGPKNLGEEFTRNSGNGLFTTGLGKDDVGALRSYYSGASTLSTVGDSGQKAEGEKVALNNQWWGNNSTADRGLRQLEPATPGAATALPAATPSVTAVGGLESMRRSAVAGQSIQLPSSTTDGLASSSAPKVDPSTGLALAAGDLLDSGAVTTLSGKQSGGVFFRLTDTYTPAAAPAGEAPPTRSVQRGDSGENRFGGGGMGGGGGGGGRGAMPNYQVTAEAASSRSVEQSAGRVTIDVWAGTPPINGTAGGTLRVNAGNLAAGSQIAPGALPWDTQYGNDGKSSLSGQLPVPTEAVNQNSIVIRDKVPVLGDLPMLGQAFRSESKAGESLGTATKSLSDMSDSKISDNVYEVNVVGYYNISTNAVVLPNGRTDSTMVLSSLNSAGPAEQRRWARSSSSSIALPNRGIGAPSVSVDNAGNLVVVADQATMEQVRQTVARLDTPTKQALIEANPVEPALKPLLFTNSLSARSGAAGTDLETEVIPLRFAKAEQLAEALRTITSTNSTVAAGVPARRTEVERAFARKPEPVVQEQIQLSRTVEEALVDYAALTGKQLVRPPTLPAGTITLTNPASGSKEQKIAELEVKLALTGITTVQVGDKFIKAVPAGQASQVGATLDPAPAKPAAPPPVPQPEVLARENAFSTFSLNVSDVSFKLAGASLEKGVMPEPASIRTEEFINAFDYRDPEASPGAAIAFASERARYPFAHNRDLLRFSIKTGAAGRQAGRPLNLVLLLDNSGSMERADRVRIIREALRVLASQLQPQDKLSVVTFSRTPRLWVDGLSGDQAGEAVKGLASLTPEGGTNLEEAMNLAYATAKRHYLATGINRVVLLTDGAANLGNVEPDALKQKVEAHRKQGIALDCFGIGWEGYNDDLLEVLSRNGDGRYGFINSPEEASTEFAAQLAGALKVAASDVKVQVEFNPKRVISYRQIGYAKHQLTKEQFRDNTVDAAEIAAQEAGNALYTVEVNPAGEGPIATVRVRYKVPGTTTYREQEWAVPFNNTAVPLEQASSAMRLAATASAFSEWLATSPFAAEVTPDRLLTYLSGVPEVCGADTRAQRLEWMIRQAKSIGGR